MKIFNPWLISLTVALISGCDSEPTAIDKAISAVQKHVVRDFKDPSSVEFRNVKAKEFGNDGDIIVCGELNAKNSYGGYIGFAEFYGHVNKGNFSKVLAVNENTSSSYKIPWTNNSLCNQF